MTDRADPILLEVMRSRLQAVVDEGALAIERTAVSPIVAEGKDFSTNILDPAAGVLVGGGKVEFKWAVARNIVLATMSRYGATIAPGDVFAGNDPHCGGGNHPQDIEVCRPVFVDGELVGWIAASAHLIDVGGMLFGSWAPDATECFQEAVRLPPVRLFAGGVEQRDIWDLFLNNVRLPRLVEMDVRGLVAGCHVSAAKLEALVRSMGRDEFVATAAAMCDNTERVLRSRIAALADGHYHVDGWAEWGPEQYLLPCSLTVAGDELRFDFTGAPPQVPHFINSKHYIISGQIVSDVRNLIGQDLPYCDGLFRPIEVICPRGTIVDSTPPAPIASAHLDVAMNCTALATQCIQLALAASDDPALPRLLSGPSGQAALANHSWSYRTEHGGIDGFVLSEAFQPGSSAGVDHDGTDLFANIVGTQSVLDFVDIEIIEAWYPLEILEKRADPGTHGAGEFRSGSGCRMSYRVQDGYQLGGAMFGMREVIPIGGLAGGYPGAPTEFSIHRRDGSTDVLSAHASGATLEPGEVFEFRAGSGGGWGDPLHRRPDLVARDVTVSRITATEAASVYGVVVDGGRSTNGDGASGRRGEGAVEVDEAATVALRNVIRRERLDRAVPPVRIPARAESATATGTVPAPLYHGVVQQGRHAISLSSGAVLATAPDHWTDGCAVLEEPRSSASGIPWLQRVYLDPVDATVLFVEAVPVERPRSFTTLPTRWTDAAPR